LKKKSQQISFPHLLCQEASSAINPGFFFGGEHLTSFLLYCPKKSNGKMYIEKLQNFLHKWKALQNSQRRNGFKSNGPQGQTVSLYA
jgi:hypothetical protein